MYYNIRTDNATPTPTFSEGNIHYTYDDIYQLTDEERKQSDNSTRIYLYEYTYDKFGNRTDKDVDTDGDGEIDEYYSYIYNPANELVFEDGPTNDWYYVYDGNGNLTYRKDNLTTPTIIDEYTYNYQNQLTEYDPQGSSNTTTYTYNLAGERVQKNSDELETNNKFVYANGQIIAEYEGTSEALLRTNIWGLRATTFINNGTPDTLYYTFRDGFNSVYNIIDASGNVQNTYDYTAFGESYNWTGSFTNAFTFNNNQYNSESTAYFNGSTYRNPNNNIYFQGQIEDAERWEREPEFHPRPEEKIPPYPPMYEDPKPVPLPDRPYEPYPRSGFRLSFPNTCGPDVTDWFVEELRLHRNFFQSFVNLHDTKIKQLVQGGYLLKNWGPSCSYKYMSFKSKNCPRNKFCRNTVTLCNTCIHVSELGNIMFGFVSMILVYNEFVILYGGIDAASNSSTGGIDSKEDIAGTIAGFSIWDMYYKKGLTLTSMNFCQYLRLNKTGWITENSKRYDASTKMGSTVLGLFALLSGNMLNDMRYAGCAPCKDKLSANAKHSVFPTPLYKLTIYNWSSVYQSCGCREINVSKVP